MDRTPLANAGGHRFASWSGKIPHAAEQLSPQFPKPLCREPVPHNKGEAAVRSLCTAAEGSPAHAAGARPHTATGPSAAVNKRIN